jgi:hypothetical protein
MRCGIICVQKKRTSFGFGKHIVVLPIDFLIGNVGIGLVELFKGCWIGYENGMWKYIFQIIGRLMQSLFLKIC